MWKVPSRDLGGLFQILGDILRGVVFRNPGRVTHSYSGQAECRPCPLLPRRWCQRVCDNCQLALLKHVLLYTQDLVQPSVSLLLTHCSKSVFLSQGLILVPR